MNGRIRSGVAIVVGALAMGWRRRLRVVSVSALALPMACHSTQDAENRAGQLRQADTIGTCSLGVPCTFALATPSTLPPAALVLSTTSSLQIDDRVTVTESNGSPATIANLGTGSTQIGTDGKLGDIWSNGRVTIGDRTLVNGTIHGAVAINPGSGVTVKAKDPKAFPALTATSTVTFPTTNSGNVDVEPGVTSPLRGGAYGSVTVKSNGLLTLGAGSYLMDSLDLEPSSRLALDTTAGPVRLYVRSTAILRGSITTTTDARDLTLVYFGSADLFVEAPLNATVIASIAKINLRSVSPLSGAFFAKSIEVGPGDVITHRATRTSVLPVRNGRVEAETFDSSSGGQNEGTVVDGLSGGSWLLFRGVDFGTAGQFNRVRFNLLSPTGVDEVALHVDSLTGPVAADLPTLPTGPGGYIVESAALSPTITGVHDTYLVITGAEPFGIDWFELYKGPSRKVANTQAPRLPPGTSFPDVTPLPSEAQDDAPDNALWTKLPQNVQIPAHGADGFMVNPTKAVTMMAQVLWKGGSGPVEVLLFDKTPSLVAAAAAQTFPADNRFMGKWTGLAPQQLNIVVRNNGDTPVTVNTLVGFVPAP